MLTDIHMPDMDGFELTRQIRAEEALARSSHRIPIVALTANALKGEADRCLSAGMDGYLTKPLTLDRLRETVTRWMSEETEPQAAPTVASAASHAIDRAVVAQMFGDNVSMIDRVLTRFAAAGEKLMADIVAAADDPRKLTDMAHKLKGAARAAGATRLGDLAANLEHSGDRADITRLVGEWQKVLQELLVNATEETSHRIRLGAFLELFPSVGLPPD